MEHHSLFLHLWVDFSVLTEVGAASYQPHKADVVISCHKLVGLSLESLNALPPNHPASEWSSHVQASLTLEIVFPMSDSPRDLEPLVDTLKL